MAANKPDVDTYTNDLKGRADCVAYAEKFGIPPPKEPMKTVYAEEAGHVTADIYTVQVGGIEYRVPEHVSEFVNRFDFTRSNRDWLRPFSFTLIGPFLPLETR